MEVCICKLFHDYSVPSGTGDDKVEQKRGDEEQVQTGYVHQHRLQIEYL